MTERTYTQRELDDALRAHGRRVLTEAREAVAGEWCSPRTRHADGECDWCTAHRADLAAIDRLIEAQS